MGCSFNPEPLSCALIWQVRSTDRFTHMTVAACKLALADAHLDVKGIDSQRLGDIAFIF